VSPLLLGLLACADPEAPPDWEGLYDADPLNPFPSMELVSEEGTLALPADALAVPEGGTAFPVDRVNWRRGFSPVQTSVWHPELALDPATVGGQDALGVGGSVRLYDLTDGVELPCFAELDAWPDPPEQGGPALLVRPGVAVPEGHQVAVVVTDAVRAVGGGPAAPERWSEAVAADPHLAELDARLAALGAGTVALAWDYPVADATGVLDALLPTVGVPVEWTLTASDRSLPEGAHAVAEGHFVAPTWLVDGLVFDTDGPVPTPQGETEVYLYAWIPSAIAESPGPHPVMVFGHGILGEPDAYFEDPIDEDGVIAVANELGAIVVATVWRGLSTAEMVDAVQVANDFGTFPSLTDRLTESVVHTGQLLRLLHSGGLLADPFFGGRGDPGQVVYYGISLGSIEGAVVLANQETVDTAVLHVGGAAWSTMLERSSNWPPFEAAVVRTVEDPVDRQELYAVSQLLWDPVDPAAYVDRLAGRPFLWQEAIGDNQVPNFTTELLMRSLGHPLGVPGFTAPEGIASVGLPAAAPLFVQLDPQLGVPDPVNRPASDTGAHNLPRSWPGVQAQTVGVLRGGLVENPCGETGCDADHPG